MTKEYYIGKDWIVYIMVRKFKRPQLGFTIGLHRVDIDLLYVSFGIWR